MSVSSSGSAPGNAQGKKTKKPDSLLELLMSDKDDDVKRRMEDILNISLFDLYKLCLEEKHVEIATLYKNIKKPKGEQDIPKYLTKLILKLLKDERLCFPQAESDHANGGPYSKQTNNGSQAARIQSEEMHLKRGLFLWAILFNRQKVARVFWAEGCDQLGGALFASALCQRLSSRAHSYDHTDLSNELTKHSKAWEQQAIQVLTRCYAEDQEWTRSLLERRLRHWGPESSELQPTLLTIARTFEMKEFTAHTACQTLMRSAWMGYIAPETARWKILLCMFLPFLIPILQISETQEEEFSTDSKQHAERKFRRNGIRNPAYQGSQTPLAANNNQRLSSATSTGGAGGNPTCCGALKHKILQIYWFYSSPVMKMVLNVISFLIFLCLISYYSMIVLDEGADTFGALEAVIHFWILTLIMEDLRQLFIVVQRRVPLKLRHWFREQWKFDLAMYTAYFLFVPFRFLATGEGFKFTRSFFGVFVVCSFASSMQFMFALKYLGPKVIMIQSLLWDLLQYIIIFAVFMTGFGVAYQSLWFPNTKPGWRLFFEVGYYPYYQMHGELFLERYKGWFANNLSESVTDCEQNATLWELQGRDVDTRCPEPNPLLPWLLLFYLMLVNLLLANLIIAQFSYTFQLIQMDSVNVWRFYRLCMVQDYRHKPTLVPPFIFFAHLYRIVRHMCCRNKVSQLDPSIEERMTELENRNTKSESNDDASPRPDHEKNEIETIKKKLQELQQFVDKL